MGAEMKNRQAIIDEMKASLKTVSKWKWLGRTTYEKAIERMDNVEAVYPNLWGVYAKDSKQVWPTCKQEGDVS